MIFVYVDQPLPDETPAGMAGIEGDHVPAMVLEYDITMPRVGDRLFMGAQFDNRSGVVTEVRHYLSDEAADEQAECTHMVITADNKKVWVPVQAVMGVCIRVELV